MPFSESSGTRRVSPARRREPNAWAPVFGYDIFLSYSRRDAAGYAAALVVRLRELDLSVFYDQDDAPVGQELTPTLERALKASRTLVVIASPQAALTSSYVQIELRRFREIHPKRPVIVIDVGTSFAGLASSDAALGELRARDPIWIDEAADAVQSGDPTLSVVAAIEARQGHIRANRKRRITFGAGLAALALAVGAALWQAGQASENARQAERRRILSVVRSMALNAPDQLSPEHLTDELAALLAVESHRLNRRLDGDADDLVDSAIRSILDADSFAALLPEGAQGCLEAGSFAVWEPPKRAVTVRKLDGSVPQPFPVPTAGDRDYVHVLPDCRTWVINDPKTGRLEIGRVGGPGVSIDTRKANFSYTRNGQRLAAWANDGELRLWSLAQFPPADPVRVRLPGKPPFAVAVNEAGKRFLTIDFDGVLSLCQAGPLSCSVLDRLTRHKDDEGAPLGVRMAFSDDGRLTAIAGDTGLKVFEGGKVVFARPGSEAVNDIQFDPAGTHVYWGTGRPRFLRANLATGQVREYNADGDLAGPLQFDARGERLFVGDIAYPRIWRVRDQPASRLLHASLPKIPEYSWAALAVSRDGRQAWYNDGYHVMIHDLEDSREPAQAPGTGKSPRLVVPCGSEVAAAGDGEEFLWATANLPRPAQRPYEVVACSPDGTTVVTSGGFDLKVWRRQDATFREIPLPKSERQSAVHSIAVTGSEGRVVAGLQDGTIYAWDLRNPKDAPTPLGRHPFGEGGLGAVAVSSDSRWLATTGGDGVIRVRRFDITAAASPELTLRGHRGLVRAIAFNPDASQLISGGEDRTVRLWNLRRPENPPVILRGHQDTVAQVAFTPDSRRVVSQSDKFEVRLWRITLDELAGELCGKVLRNLTHTEWNQFVGSGIPYERSCASLPGDPQ